MSHPCPHCRDSSPGCFGVFLIVCAALWLFRTPPPPPRVVLADRAALAAVVGCPAAEPAGRPR